MAPINKIAVMQPYLFPYIGYFQLIRAVDKFIILDDVNYIVRGWINRNRILLNGKEHLFTMPLNKASPNKQICDITIRDCAVWRGEFLKTIGHAYRRAPFFKDAFSVVQRAVQFDADNLSAYVSNSLRVMSGYLQIPTEIILVSKEDHNHRLRGQDRIIDICLKERAKHYVNAIGGRSIYFPQKFERAGVKFSFLQPGITMYPQFTNSFVPGLSIIDVIMFSSQKSVQDMLAHYQLVSE